MKIKFLIFITIIIFAPITEVAAGAGFGGGSCAMCLIDDSPPAKFVRTYLGKETGHSPQGEVQYQRWRAMQKDDVVNGKDSNFNLTQADFEGHLALGMDRIVQFIDPEPNSIEMNIPVSSATQTWTLSEDFTSYASYDSRTMNSIPPASTPYGDEDFSEATHAFNISGVDNYAYYTVGEVQLESEIRNVVYYHGNIDATNTDHAALIQSPLPLSLSTDPYGGSQVFNCADFDDEPCSDYPTAVTHEERQTYFPQTVGTLNLFDVSSVQAIKVHLLDEIFYYDSDGALVGYDFERAIVWYSQEGHYVVALLEEDAPWEGQTEIDFIEYQRLASSSLPIQWLNFTATANSEQQVELTWTTASEQDNSHFIIQKSTNGASFTNLGEQVSKGNANQAYQFTDAKPASGTNYYRIQQVDNDGKTTLSKVITAIVTDNAAEQPTIVLYPNPGKDEVWFSQAADYELYDTKGNLLTAGRADGVVDVAGLSVGTYFVRINSGEMLQWMKQ